MFGVRRCCRLCFGQLSSADPCSVQSFRQGQAPLVLFLVLSGVPCFVRSDGYLHCMQDLFGSVLCLACRAVFRVLLLKPVLFCVLFGHGLQILFCTAFCSGLVVCWSAAFCSAFCSPKRCFVHLAKFGLNSVRVR